MRAVAYDRHGGPDVLRCVDLPDPVPGPGDVLIAVRAVALNRLDVLQREGPGILPGFALPHVPGMDVAGEIVAVGGAVTTHAVGERVVVNPALHCGRCELCLDGADPFCRELRIVGATRPGGYAELVTVPATHVHAIPDDVDFVDAATVPTAYSLAWQAMFVRGRVSADETVLVSGGGSAVSLAAVQVARRLGARVIVTSRSRTKLERVAQLGVDTLIDSSRDDVTSAVRDATGGRGVDVVFNHLGPVLFQETLSALRERGRMLVCGNITGNLVSVSLPQLYHMGITLVGVESYRYEDFGRMLSSYWSGGYTAFVDSTYPLCEAASAQVRMLDDDCFGKVVLVVPG